MESTSNARRGGGSNSNDSVNSVNVQQLYALVVALTERVHHLEERVGELEQEAATSSGDDDTDYSLVGQSAVSQAAPAPAAREEAYQGDTRTNSARS